MPQGANRSPNLSVLSQKALHLSAVTQRGASDTDADLGGIFAPLRSPPGSQQGKDTSLAVRLIQSLRWGHTHTEKVSSFQKTWQCILYPRLLSSAVWYSRGNFSTKIDVAVTKMHQKIFSACYLAIQISIACGLR